MDPATKDELHMVEVEGQDTEGQKIKAALVSLKPSTLPSVSIRIVVFAWVQSTFIITVQVDAHVRVCCRCVSVVSQSHPQQFSV